LEIGFYISFFKVYLRKEFFMMKAYEKPVADVLEEVSEGVYAASGDDGKKETEKKKCRFGRTEASARVDVCQSCSLSGGTTPDREHTYEKDYTGCVDGMPEKK